MVPISCLSLESRDILFPPKDLNRFLGRRILQGKDAGLCAVMVLGTRVIKNEIEPRLNLEFSEALPITLECWCGVVLRKWTLEQPSYI